MKAIRIAIVLALSVLQLNAQEVMKVELNEGKTVEYKIGDVKRVYFGEATPIEDDIKTTSLIMFVGDKEKIDGTVLTATSENEFVASVKNGVVSANHVGVTAIIVNEKHLIVVMVFSLYSSFPDPVLRWGEPKDSIKAHHTKGTIQEETDEILSYKDCGDAALIGYQFDKDGKLSGAFMGAKKNKGDAFFNYLMERYIISPEDTGGDYYLGLDGYEEEKTKTVIMYYLKDNYCIFYPYSRFSKSTSNIRENMARIINQWEEEK